MSLEPDRLRFVVWKGHTFRKVLHLLEEGEPLDLTGYTASMPIRTDTGVVLTLNTENGGIELGGEDGTVTLFISHTVTAAATWMLGKYNLSLISPGGDVDPLLYGNFSIKAV